MPKAPGKLDAAGSTAVGSQAVRGPAVSSTEQLGLFCSGRLPSSLILPMLDTSARLRDAGIMVMSGFHSKTERECFATLLRGTQQVIVCPAKAFNPARIPSAWKKPLAERRLSILSPFSANVHRATKETAHHRNVFIAHTADALFIPYAAPGSKTEALAKEIAIIGKPMYTLICPETTNLQKLGAKDISHFVTGRMRTLQRHLPTVGEP